MTEQRQYDKDDTDGLRIGGHQWVEANDLVKWPHCAVCGIIRRHDDRNNPCKGAAKIALRNYYTEGAAVPECVASSPIPDGYAEWKPLGIERRLRDRRAAVSTSGASEPPHYTAGRQREADHATLRRLSNMSGPELDELGIKTPEDAFNYAADMVGKNTLVSATGTPKP